MRNPLQDQLLKAGLAKKSQLAQVARDQKRKRKGVASATTGDDAAAVDAQRLQAERAERDRALAAERNAQARAHEARAQARQIIQDHKVRMEGETPYRFTDGAHIRTVYVNTALRGQLVKGALVIVRLDDGYALLPRSAGEKVAARVPELLVLDNAAQPDTPAQDGSDDEYYSRFQVPDDLVW